MGILERNKVMLGAHVTPVDKEEYDAFERWYGEDFEDYCDDLNKIAQRKQDLSQEMINFD